MEDSETSSGDTSLGDDFSEYFEDPFYVQYILTSGDSDSDYFMADLSSEIDSMLEYSAASGNDSSDENSHSGSESGSESDDEIVVVDMIETNPQGVTSEASNHIVENSNPLDPVSSSVGADVPTSFVENNSVSGNQNYQHKNDTANVSLLSENSEDDGQICSICFERWTNSDNHRLASLKCGHLFGHSCIFKWLGGQGKKCPQCNLKAKRSDIRVIFAKSLKALDTSERDRALKELQQEKEIRRKVEIESYQLKLQCDKMRDECTKLQNQISFYQKQGTVKMADDIIIEAASSSNSKTANSIKFMFHKEILVSKTGSCRVLSYCDSLNMIAISQPSTNNLFQGYGIKKISSLDFKTTELVYLHSSPIRDIAFKPSTSNGMLLSVSVDKSVKLSSMAHNSVVQEYKCESPLWSCAWNLDSLDQFFAGTTNGKILLYDTRNTSKCLEIKSYGSSSPVVSMKYIKERCNADFKYGGLLVCQLDQFSFFQTPFDDPLKKFVLPVRGSFTSVDFDDLTRQFLLSSRPHPEFPQSRHFMGELRCAAEYSSSQPFITSNILQIMDGGRSHKMLSRSKFVTCKNVKSEQMFVCAGDESSSSFMLWDVSTGNCLEKFPMSSPVLDIATATVSENNFLLALTDRMLSIYKME